MSSTGVSNLILTLAVVLFFAKGAHAFGAGNIASVAKVEGLNCKIPRTKRQINTDNKQGAMEISKTLSSRF